MILNISYCWFVSRTVSAHWQRLISTNSKSIILFQTLILWLSFNVNMLIEAVLFRVKANFGDSCRIADIEDSFLLLIAIVSV